MEEWRPIREFDQYEISNSGRIRNRNTGMNLMPARDRGGFHVNLYADGVAHTRAVHRLVADAYLVHFAGDQTLIHIDGNNENNHYYNLRWTSRSFAYRWTQQIHRKTALYKHKIGVVETSETFANSYQAAMTLVGLEEHIVGAIDNPDVSYLNRHFVTM